jgi:predicted RNase H-like nuclease
MSPGDQELFSFLLPIMLAVSFAEARYGVGSYIVGLEPRLKTLRSNAIQRYKGGAFYRTAMYAIFQYVDRKLERWARRKYKTLSRHKRRSAEWLRKMAAVYPRLFVHWRVAGATVG